MTENKNVLATIKFDADKVLPKMKKCLDKKSGVAYCLNPAIEVRTGVLIATDGHILMAHKLQGYSYSEDDKAKGCLNDVQFVPADVLTMKGTITVKVMRQYDQTVTRAENGGDDYGLIAVTATYPTWRAAIPSKTGSAITVDAKAWDAVVKNVAAKCDEKKCSITFRAAKDSTSMAIGYWDMLDEDAVYEQNVSVDAMPYNMFVLLDSKRLRNALATAPTAMHFVHGNSAVLFTNDDTLVLVMPCWVGDRACSVDPRELVDFCIDDWISGKGAVKAKTAKPTATVKPIAEPVRELSLAERLREALLEIQKRKAA